MLVSHGKQFIFTKTVKTAGTSVESYFEQFCMPSGEWRESHSRDEHVSEAGIIGYRGSNASGSTWYNHMSSRAIYDEIGKNIWDEYYKFTTVRNPFDKLISGFFMFDKERTSREPVQKLKAIARRILGKAHPMDRVKGKTEIERFRSWVRQGGSIIDRDKYMLDGEECVDYFIRFENLQAGIEHVCNVLSIPFEPFRIPEFKKGLRHNEIEIRDYYDQETENIVRELYAWELDRFGYDMPN